MTTHTDLIKLLRELQASQADNARLREALELYRGQIDNAGKHSAADALTGADMKPIAYMGHYDTDNIREAGCVVTRDKDDLKFQRNGKPDRIDELYTADQLRQAKVEVLREAVTRLPSYNENHVILGRMADELSHE